MLEKRRCFLLWNCIEINLFAVIFLETRLQTVYGCTCTFFFSVLWNHVVLKRDQVLTCIGYNDLLFRQRCLTFFGIGTCFVFFRDACWVFLRENCRLAWLPSSLPFRFFLQCVFSYFWVEWSPQILVAPLKLSSGSFSRHSVLQMP